MIRELVEKSKQLGSKNAEFIIPFESILEGASGQATQKPINVMMTKQEEEKGVAEEPLIGKYTKAERM